MLIIQASSVILVRFGAVFQRARRAAMFAYFHSSPGFKHQTITVGKEGAGGDSVVLLQKIIRCDQERSRVTEETQL